MVRHGELALRHSPLRKRGGELGAGSGQEIFHAHCHVIPRYADEPLAGKGIRDWLKQEENGLKR